MTGSPPSRGHLAALVLAAAAWGIGTVISKRAVAEVAPLTLIALQLAASVVALGLLMRSRGIPLRGGQPVLLGRLGVLNPGIAYALSLVGLTTISASLSVLLWALEPILILVLAVAFLRERVTLALVGASAVAAIGAALVVYEPGDGGQLIGAALTVAGVGCCAVYTIVTRRFIAASDATAPVVLAQQLHALAFALASVLVVAVAGGGFGMGSLTGAGLASAIASGLLYYAAAYWLYLSALRQLPASIAAVSFYLIPLFGLAGASVLLGERLEPSQWLGGALILIAVVTILRPRPETSRIPPVGATPDGSAGST